MTASILAFLGYFVTSVVLLAVFTVAYVKFTPYKEFDLISKGNVAAAISLAGAVLGFVFPLVAAIFYTHSIMEMALWSSITCAVQFVLFVIMKKRVLDIEFGNVASAIMLASFSIAVGMLNAVCISY